MSLGKDTNEKTMLIAPPPQRRRSGVPAAVELLGGFSELGLAPGEQSPAPSQLVKQPTDEITEHVRLIEEARIAEMLFERAAPILPEAGNRRFYPELGIWALCDRRGEQG